MNVVFGITFWRRKETARRESQAAGPKPRRQKEIRTGSLVQCLNDCAVWILCQSQTQFRRQIFFGRTLQSDAKSLVRFWLWFFAALGPPSNPPRLLWSVVLWPRLPTDSSRHRCPN